MFGSLKSLVLTYVNVISSGDLPCMENAVLVLAQIENLAAMKKVIVQSNQQIGGINASNLTLTFTSKEKRTSLESQDWEEAYGSANVPVSFSRPHRLYFLRTLSKNSEVKLISSPYSFYFLLLH